MKLHLPLPLRSALLAVCVAMVNPYVCASEGGFTSIDDEHTYDGFTNHGAFGLDLDINTAGCGGVFYSSWIAPVVITLLDGTYNYTNNTAETQEYKNIYGEREITESGAYGGALYIGITSRQVDKDTLEYNTIINSTANFEGNKAITSSLNEDNPAEGGAINFGSNSVFVNNSTLNFTRNAAISTSAKNNAYGGAISFSDCNPFWGGDFWGGS